MLPHAVPPPEAMPSRAQTRPAPPLTPRRGLSVPLMLLALIGMTFAVYLPVLRHGFVNWDDQTEIYQNPDLDPVTLRGVAWNWTHTRMTVYMPLTYTTWAGIALLARQPPDAQGITLNPFWFHLAGVAFHACGVALVFLILRRLTTTNGAGTPPKTRDWAAALGAAVFAVHPLQVEPVAWASGMYTVLSGALSLWALWHYLRYAQRIDGDGAVARSSDGADPQDVSPHGASLRGVSRRGPPIDFALATFAFVLAMLAKPTAVALPLVAASLDWLLIRRDVRRLLAPMVVWLVLAGGVYAVASRFHPANTVDVPLHHRPIVALDALWFYLTKVVRPANLIPDYGRWPGWVMQRRATALTVIASAALLLVAWLLRRRAPRVAAPVAVFVFGLLPYLGLVKFDYQWFSTVADRYAYLAMLGVGLAVALFVSTRRVRVRRLAVVATCLALVLLVVINRRQQDYWTSTQRLFGHTLEVRPDSLVAHSILGFDVARAGRDAEAEAHYRAALASRPNDSTVNFNYGNFLRQHGRGRQATDYYQAAVDSPAGAGNAMYHLNYGQALVEARRWDEAALEFERAIELAQGKKQDFPEAHQNLGMLLALSGNDAAAVVEFRRALAINPDYAPAQRQLVAAFERLRDRALATTRAATQPSSGPSTGPSHGR
jgi:Tfp pilus assembly protein PilF